MLAASATLQRGIFLNLVSGRAQKLVLAIKACESTILVAIRPKLRSVASILRKHGKLCTLCVKNTDVPQTVMPEKNNTEMSADFERKGSLGTQLHSYHNVDKFKLLHERTGCKYVKSTTSTGAQERRGSNT